MEDASAATDASSATDRASWLALMETIGDSVGYFEPLGNNHWAFFVDESPTLLVTFESLGAIRSGSPDQMPIGHSIASAHGWSHLCLIADGETWYRDPAVFRYFDRLVDDAFFEDFDRVVFYGAGMGGYAACAFSVTSPGATVLAIQPVATLDPALAGWDTRHRQQRRLSFSDRYGFAPDMTEGAGDVYLIHDPRETIDAMHAALFARPYVHNLRCPNLGPRLEMALSQMGILRPLIEAACDGTLSPGMFHRLYRERRRHIPYLRQVFSRLGETGRPLLAALLARNVSTRMPAPRFKKRFTELQAQLAVAGQVVPSAQSPRGSTPRPEEPVADDTSAED